MKLQEAIDKRHSVRSYLDKKVPLDKIIEALDAASKAPFAGNKNNLKFIVVIDEKEKLQISKYTAQDWVQDANVIIVVCADEGHLENLYQEHAKKYTNQHLGASIENLMLRITDLGLGTCWIGSFIEEGVRKTLDIPKNISIEAILPIGYEKTKQKRIKKTPLEDLIFWDKWNISKKPNYTKNPSTW